MRGALLHIRPWALATLQAGLSGQVDIGVIITPSMTLVERLKNGQPDFLIARIPEQEDESSLLHEDLSEETECAVVRLGHPMLGRDNLTLKELSTASWVLSPQGSDLETPTNVVETTAMSVIKSVLQQTDFLHIMPLEVARYYVNSRELAILPIDLPCTMDSFGIITRANP